MAFQVWHSTCYHHFTVCMRMSGLVSFVMFKYFLFLQHHRGLQSSVHCGGTQSPHTCMHTCTCSPPCRAVMAATVRPCCVHTSATLGPAGPLCNHTEESAKHLRKTSTDTRSAPTAAAVEGDEGVFSLPVLHNCVGPLHRRGPACASAPAPRPASAQPSSTAAAAKAVEHTAPGSIYWRV